MKGRRGAALSPRADARGAVKGASMANASIEALAKRERERGGGAQRVTLARTGG